VALLEKRRYLNNRSGDFPQVILIVPSHVPNRDKIKFWLVTPSSNPSRKENPFKKPSIIEKKCSFPLAGFPTLLKDHFSSVFFSPPFTQACKETGKKFKTHHSWLFAEKIPALHAIFAQNRTVRFPLLLTKSFA
jgi:hypothetical protein